MFGDILLEQCVPAALTGYAYLSKRAGRAPPSRTWWMSKVSGTGSSRCSTSPRSAAARRLALGRVWRPVGAGSRHLLGTMTAVGGGTVRDVVSRRTPGIVGGFRHVTCALVAVGVMVVLNRLRFVSAGRWRDWQLPQPHRWRPVTALAQHSDDWLRRGRGRSRAAGESPKHTGQAEISSDEPREQP
jgi:hypothetical protein